MVRYPFECKIMLSGYTSDVDDGIVTMRSIDGHFKTHHIYGTTAYAFTFHHYFDNDEIAELFNFYSSMKGSTFLLKSPDDDVELVARFTSRPKMVQFNAGRGRVMVVTVAGNPRSNYGHD